MQGKGDMERSVVILGAAGFVGAAVTRAAVAAGYRVLAVVRSPGALEYVETLGAHPLRGDAAVPGAWIHATAGADALIDLTQPALPTRLTVRAMTRMAHQRLATTEALLGAFRTLPAERRPLWISVSGTDDLLPDARGVLSSASRPRQRPRGFAHIGLPVRAALAASGEAVAFVHFGQMVYGPGKAYAAVIAEGVRTGSARVIGRGDNRLPLTHVHDAAAALTHLVALDRAQLAGRTIVAAPASPDTQRDLFTLTARALGAPAPKHASMLLAALVAGRANAEAMTLDVPCDPDILTETGFAFRYATLAAGIPATLAALRARDAHP